MSKLITYKVMRGFYLILFFVSFSFYGIGQKGSVHIEQDKKIDQLMELYKSANSSTDYYTIQVGFGSYRKAENLKAEVDIDFPGWSSKIIFDSPTYRVHVGRFKTKLEAERKFIEVRQKYPASLLLKPED